MFRRPLVVNQGFNKTFELTVLVVMARPGLRPLISLSSLVSGLSYQLCATGGFNRQRNVADFAFLRQKRL